MGAEYGIFRCKIKQEKRLDMERSIRVEAPAKINAYLEITGRRPDGYHTILTHMQAVTLCDVLTLAWRPWAHAAFSVELTCTAASLGTGEDNLVCRAARALADCAKARGCAVGGVLSVHLEKNIPMAAGLAGGSADAAATLRACNELLAAGLSTDELCEIAVTLGADIPFCVRCTEQAAMTAGGIGEVLTPAPTLPGQAYLVIACHGEGVSTPWAYRMLDEHACPDAEQTERRYEAFLAAVESGSLTALSSHAYNCFETVVLPERGAVAMLMQEMTQAGATFARMSGSGPSVVGYFDREGEARNCVASLAKKGITAHICRPFNSKNNA